MILFNNTNSQLPTFTAVSKTEFRRFHRVVSLIVVIASVYQHCYSNLNHQLKFDFPILASSSRDNSKSNLSIYLLF